MVSFPARNIVSAGGGGGDTDGGSDGGADQLDVDEQDTSTGGGDSANALVQLTVLADSLFDFDPTIDTTRTAAENAQGIEQNVRGNLGTSEAAFRSTVVCSAAAR
jgi:hypothetical protein